MAQEASVPPGTATADRADLDDLIDHLQITEVQRQMLRGRWLDQMAYMGRKANQARHRYYWLRSIIVIGGVMVPAFISLSLAWDVYGLRILTFLLSLGVACVAAADELLGYGDRWRHYRSNEEMLKSEGWQYLMGIGPYAKLKDPEQAYKTFSTRVEAILRQDIAAYMESIARASGSDSHDVFTNV